MDAGGKQTFLLNKYFEKTRMHLSPCMLNIFLVLFVFLLFLYVNKLHR